MYSKTLNSDSYLNALNTLTMESVKIIKNSGNINLSQVIPNGDKWTIVIYYTI